MSEQIKISDLFKSLPTGQINSVLGIVTSTGEPLKATARSLANLAFVSVASDEDLDNPTTRGIFNASKATITRPAKGKGWSYGFVLNLAAATGVQVWVNFEGYIAVRGKGSADGEWSDWSVMAKM